MRSIIASNSDMPWLGVLQTPVSPTAKKAPKTKSLFFTQYLFSTKPAYAEASKLRCKMKKMLF